MSLQSFFNLENLSGSIASFTSIIGLLPQIYKSYRIKSTGDVSMLMMVNYFICSIAWIIHGSYVKSDFIVYSNVSSLILSGVAIGQKRIYDALPRKHLES
ncbi:MAG: PQ-loop repeat-containing protein [Holosporaceae bacterium]|nr:PQ-loop repeat-containing protein [Holosporaceae bacterium]